MTPEEKREEALRMRAMVKRVKGQIRITKVVATRALKGRSGDVFVGFSAAFDSVQEDGGQGLEGAMDDGERDVGVSLEEARVAAILLGCQADIAATRNALGGSMITKSDADVRIAGIKNNFDLLLKELLQKD